MFCHAQSHVNPPLISKCSAPKPEKETSLYKAFEKRNREFIGTALTIRNETAEPQIVAQDFNSVTPENAMKWESTEPSRNNFTFAGGDAVVAFAKKYDTEIHCHTLVWHSQLPTWVSGGGFDNKTLISIMENHIKNVAGRWKGACTRWDVVNEALNEDGTYRKSVFLDTIGEAYIPIAFRLAAKYAKGSKLYYNDYNMETVNNKTLAVRALVKDFKKRGVPIDGVGLQAHFITGSSPSYDQIRAAQQLYTSLGLETALTELDVRTNLPDDATKQATQAKNYADSVRACVDEKRCVGVTVWDFWDPVSWVPSTFPGQGDADLYNTNFSRKPAYAAVVDVLAKAAK